MGQAVSSGSISSIFLWPGFNSRNPPTNADDGSRECSEVIAQSENKSNVPQQHQKNFKSLSCFRTQDTTEETLENNVGESATASTSQHSDVKKSNEEMPSSKKCYNFCKKTDEDNKTQNSSKTPSEINGNQVDSVQSCSSENSNLRGSASNSTSINRYVSAFADMSVEGGDAGKTPKEVTPKPKECKRASKQKKISFKECNGCSKESKGNNNKLGAKKKNTWMKFYSSKLGKANNNAKGTTAAAPNAACSSTSDSDSACVCTSYKKVDDGKQETSGAAEKTGVEQSAAQQNLTQSWVNDHVNRNTSSNWSLVADGSNIIYNIQNRGTECISCEGSHCHLEWNALAELSNISRLPINITVTRVATAGGSQSSPGATTEGNVILLSLGTQRPDFNFRSDDLPVEDCDMRDRITRALEIAEGIEVPVGYSSHQIQVVSPEELRALLFQQQLPASAISLNNQPISQRARIHTQVDYIHCLVPDLRSITGCSFYWGKMDRYEAERLLDGKPEGTFLLRDSAQEEYLFSVSFRKYQRSLHARIEQFNHKFSFDSHDPAVFASDTVTGLIEHYKDPTCVMFFEPMLTAPLSRTFTFSLQHLCRAAIVSCTTYDGINELRLPQGIKAYLKEYHYRQRVRVKRFDVSPESSEESQ